MLFLRADGLCTAIDPQFFFAGHNCNAHNAHCNSERPRRIRCYFCPNIRVLTEAIISFCHCTRPSFFVFHSNVPIGCSCAVLHGSAHGVQSQSWLSHWPQNDLPSDTTIARKAYVLPFSLRMVCSPSLVWFIGHRRIIHDYCFEGVCVSHLHNHVCLMTCLGESRSIVCRPVTNRLYIPDQMDCDFHAKSIICSRNDELHHTLLLLEHLCFSRNMLDTMLKPISGLCRVFHAQILRSLFVIVLLVHTKKARQGAFSKES